MRSSECLLVRCRVFVGVLWDCVTVGADGCGSVMERINTSTVRLFAIVGLPIFRFSVTGVS